MIKENEMKEGRKERAYHGSVYDFEQFEFTDPIHTDEELHYSIPAIYCTSNRHSAVAYAYASAEACGGEPILYEVEIDVSNFAEFDPDAVKLEDVWDSPYNPEYTKRAIQEAYEKGYAGIYFPAIPDGIDETTRWIDLFVVFDFSKVKIVEKTYLEV